MDKIKTNFKNPYSEKLAEFELDFIEEFANSDLSQVEITILNEDGSKQEESNMLEAVVQIASTSFSRGYTEGQKDAVAFSGSYISLLIAEFANWLEEKGIVYDPDELDGIIHKVTAEANSRYKKDNS